jgi:hypothetical protein
MSTQPGAFYPQELDAMARLLERAAGELGLAKGSPERDELARQLMTLTQLPINEEEVVRILVAGHARKVERWLLPLELQTGRDHRGSVGRSGPWDIPCQQITENGRGFTQQCLDLRPFDTIDAVRGLEQLDDQIDASLMQLRHFDDLP